MKCEAIDTVGKTTAREDGRAVRGTIQRTVACAEEATVRLVVTRMMYFDGSSDDETMAFCQKHFEQECEDSDVEPEDIIAQGWARPL